MNMLKLAIKGKERLSLDEYELNSGKDVNYSIDTARYFKEKYPNDKLFYLIGVDQVNEFHRWKEADKLSEIVQLVYYTRPGYKVKSDNIAKYNMQKIEGSGIEVSSTAIRELKSFELPDEVLFYIVEHDLYKGMVDLNFILTPHRLAHSKSVAKTAYEIAKANNLDEPLKAYVAGLFHDIGKDIAEDKQFEMTKKYYPEYSDIPRFAYHQFAGAHLVQEMFGIKDKDIIEAIEFHSTGNENMCLLAKIIYAADKIEPTRGFDSSYLINAMKNDAENGFVTVLEANREFLLSKNKNINNRLTYKCFQQYLG
jgi:nicotinate-nucleotide adenylyltransferase